LCPAGSKTKTIYLTKFKKSSKLKKMENRKIDPEDLCKICNHPFAGEEACSENCQCANCKKLKTDRMIEFTNELVDSLRKKGLDISKTQIQGLTIGFEIDRKKNKYGR